MNTVFLLNVAKRKNLLEAVPKPVVSNLPLFQNFRRPLACFVAPKIAWGIEVKLPVLAMGMN